MNYVREWPLGEPCSRPPATRLDPPHTINYRLVLRFIKHDKIYLNQQTLLNEEYYVGLG